MPNEADDTQHREVALSGTWFRLIPSRFPTIELYERVATPEQSSVLKSIEMMTNPRKHQKEAATHTSGATVETSHKFQNWNHAPFAYPQPAGSRYLSQHFSALELFDSLDAALAVAVRKREAFLDATSEPRMAIDMRLLMHDFKGRFVDRLSDLPDMSTLDRWAVGSQLFRAGRHGVYYRCPELPRCFAVSLFNGDGLGPAKQAQHFRFLWDGARISTIYPCTLDGDDETSPIFPADIFADKTV